MIQLDIAGRQAVIKSGTSFKLTRMNPFFEDSGDYTLEVELPLLGCRTNQEIFGTIHRPDASLVGLVGKHFEMSLIAPPLNVCGYAEVTTVTEDAVKVQLVAGRSALTHAIEDDETYIANLDLGRCWDSNPVYEWTNYKGEHADFQPGQDMRSMAIFLSNPQDTEYCYDENGNWIDYIHADDDTRQRTMFGKQSQTDSVCYSIYSTDSEERTNELYYNYNSKRLTTEIGLSVSGTLIDGTTAPGDTVLSGYEYDYDSIRLAPQPYLLDLIKRVIKTAGFKVGDWSYYENSPLVSGIFIVNSRVTIERAEMLPNWTISEFLKEVQNLLSCVFFVKSGKRVNMIPRVQWLQDMSERTELVNVSDELSTEIEDEDSSSADISTGNIEYSWSTSDDILRLPDEIWENAEIREYASKAEIDKAFSALTDPQKAQSRYLYKDTSNGRCYASLSTTDTPTKYSLERVDHYPPLLHDTSTRDISHALKIVPARIRMLSSVETIYNYLPVDYPILESDDTTLRSSLYYNIDAAINSNSDESNEDITDKRDTLLVGWNQREVHTSAKVGTSTTDIYTIPVAIGLTYYKNEDTNFYEGINSKASTIEAGVPNDGPFSLTETPTDYQAQKCGNIGTLHGTSIKVDTRCKHLFQFTDNVELDPTVPYLIHGKLYACYKLELTIDENGIQPLKKGYFCEIH